VDLPPEAEITHSLMMRFAAYLSAEWLEVSGVLAASPPACW
jgi:hypothetical protein